MCEPILEVRGLTQRFQLHGNTSITVFEEVSFAVHSGEIFGLTGESGSGKSTLARCIMGLYRPTAGSVCFRGRCMQMIFQDSLSAMNPRMTIGQIVAEPLVIRRIGSREEQRERVAELLTITGLDPACAGGYPADLSGGQQQRVCIARALALDPDLLVADEPIASLDAAVQAQIVNLFHRLQQERGVACVFISHDPAMVRHLCHRSGILRDGHLL